MVLPLTVKETLGIWIIPPMKTKREFGDTGAKRTPALLNGKETEVPLN
jgi:hypothetical protein